MADSNLSPERSSTEASHGVRKLDAILPITWKGFACDPDRFFFEGADGELYEISTQSALDGYLDLPTTNPARRDWARTYAHTLASGGLPPDHPNAPSDLAEPAIYYVARRNESGRLIEGSRLSKLFDAPSRRDDAFRALQVLRLEHANAAVFHAESRAMVKALKAG